MIYNNGIMSDELKKTIDTSQNVGAEEVSEEGEPKQAKGGALSGLNRLLSEDEMKDNPAAFKLILDKVDMLQTEAQNLSEYREKFHEEKTKAEVLGERLKFLDDSINSKSALILFGGILLGYLPSLWSNTAVFVTAVIIAIILLFLGFLNIISKLFKK